MNRDLILGSKGDLTVRLAEGTRDIEAAQQLRYHVFYEELDARASPETLALRRDADRFDPICDHLLVVKSDDGGHHGIRVSDGELVGTYRLLRQSVAEANFGFYTQAEFDIAPLVARKPDLNFLELGRSCVLKRYRTKPVVELLWQGIWNYVRLHQVDVMLGCASFEGTNPQAHALALTFLAVNCAAPDDWRVSALPARYIDMHLMGDSRIEMRQALKALPPLIKGYVRLGCYIGDGAVIDPQFNTIDVLITLPTTAINQRYASHFGASDTDPAG